MKNLGAVTLLGLAFYILINRQGTSFAGSIKLSVYDIHAIAQQITAKHNLNASACMVAAMSMVESGDYRDMSAGVNTLATRNEPHIGDKSIGVMQTLYGTAKWLADEMGYNAYGSPSVADLYNPEVSVYFGAAYIDWLSHYRGLERSERWIVESYNGGPNASNAQTQNHFAKYSQAKGILDAGGLC